VFEKIVSPGGVAVGHPSSEDPEEDSSLGIARSTWVMMTAIITLSKESYWYI
jgi:hypothetical protein